MSPSKGRPQGRPAGLLAYLSLTALSVPAARRRIAAEMARGGAGAARLAEQLGRSAEPRPDDTLLWLHASDPVQAAALTGLARLIAGDHPEFGFLMTCPPEIAAAAEAAPLPPRTLWQIVPLDSGGTAGDFLDHWRPDLLLWAGATLRPALLAEAARRAIPLWMIDAASAPPEPPAWRRFPGLTAAVLRGFDGILATDDDAARALVEAGARKASVQTAGRLEEETPAPPCNLRERDTLAEVLQARPVWLAAAVPEDEEAAVLATFRAAARIAHRLMLILAPADPERGPRLAAKFAMAGLSVALRSADGEPTRATEVFVADGEGEYGLWYRLAPVTYMGGTLLADQGGGRSPLEPAALGSAILHGPHTGPQEGLYRRFAAAGAARPVAEPSELAEALAELLSPDRAAELAHAAWNVSTGGAEVSGRVRTIVSEALTRRGES